MSLFSYGTFYRCLLTSYTNALKFAKLHKEFCHRVDNVFQYFFTLSNSETI